MLGLFTADLLVAHLVGDYLLQADWMAGNKTTNNWAAAAHAVTYTLPFVLFTQEIYVLAAIAVSHFVIDRWRLVRYFNWIKNFLAPKHIKSRMAICMHPKDPIRSQWFTRIVTNEEEEVTCDDCGERASNCPSDKVLRNHPWHECSGTGYHKDRPAFLAVWLMIIADNTLHLICNALAFRYLG